MQVPASVLPCLVAAAQICKLPVPPDLHLPASGMLDSDALENLAERLHLGLTLLHGESLEELMQRPLAAPAILALRNGRAVLLVGQIRAKKLAVIVEVGMEGSRQTRLPVATLAGHWSGLAVLLHPQRQPHRHVRALVSLARHHGKDLAAEDLIHTYLLSEQEPDQSLFMRMLAEQGLEGRTAPASLDGLAQMPSALPVLLHCRGGGLLVLWEMADDGSLEVENPDQPQAGRVRVPRDEVEKLLDGRVTFVKAVEVEGSIPEGRKPFGLGFFLREIRQMKANMAEVGLAALALQVIALAMPLFFQIIIDRVVTHQVESTLHVLALGMLGAILFEGAFGWLRSYLLLYTTSVIDLRLAIRTFEHLSSISLPFFERVPAGVLIKHMQQPEKIREFLTGRLFGTLLDSISLLVVLPVLLAYSWRLTLLVLLFSGLCALVIYLAMGPFRARLQDLYATEGERQAFLVENIHAMPTVKSLSLEPMRRRGWDNRAAVATGMRFRVGKMSIAISTFMQIMQKCMGSS